MAAAPGKVAGQARAFQASMEQDPVNPQWQWTVWRFRLERFDPAGNRLTPVSVEMRGRSFRGAVTDGDWIEVGGAPVGGDTLRVTRVRNLTTESDVVAVQRTWPPVLWILFGVMIVVVLAITIAAVSFFLRTPWPGFPSDAFCDMSPTPPWC